jgi:hypothetical protein
MHEHRTTTIARTPSHLPTPPPLALDLRHAGRPVGWVRGDTIGFRGFASNAEALHAAWVAYRALAQRLAKAGERRPIPVDTERLTLSRSGDVDLVVASGRPIATIVRPGPTSLSGDSFGFELRVPAPTYESRMRGMAYLVYRTLRKSGVRWALWARDREKRERRGDATPAANTTSPRAPRPDSRGARQGMDWGFALFCVFLLVALALVVPHTAVIPLGVVVLGALALVGALELPRRWWARRARAAEAMKRGDARRWPTVVTITATASVVGLLLAFVVPEHLAGPLGVLGLIGLLASRLLLPRAGRSVTREILPPRTDRETPTERAVRDEARAPKLDRDAVYDAALESFPASDAPSWGALRVGPPALDARRPVRG